MAVQFDVTGDNTGFLRALEQSVAAAKKAGGDVNSAFKGVSDIFESITKAVGIFASVLAGGEAFKEAVEATKQLTEESINLGKSMGISASAASAYAVAIEDVGGTTDDVAGATQGLTRQLKSHEGALNDMGIATRDSQGHLRDMNDIMIDAITTVNSYKEGTDRNLAAQTAFGRGMSASNPILKLTKEGMEEAKATAMELGLVVGQQNVRDFEANRKATADAGDVMRGLKKAVGDELMPTLTSVGEWFRSVGPSAIEALRGALVPLVAIFEGLLNGINILWQTLSAMLASITVPLAKFVEAIYHALSGNWQEAKGDLASIGPFLKQTWSDAFTSIVASSRQAATDISKAFNAVGGPGAAADSPGGGKDFKTAPKGSGGQEKSTQYAQELISEANTILDEMKGIYAQEADAFRETQLGEIATKEEALKEQLKLGEVSATQFLTLERELIEQRLEANREFYAKKMELETKDSVAAAKIQRDITKAETDAQKQRQTALNTAINSQMTVWNKLGSQVASSFTSALDKMLAGTFSFAAAIRGLVEQVLNNFVRAAIQGEIRYIAAEQAKAAASKASAAVQKEANADAATDSLNQSGTAALKKILNDAYQAASGAYQATVGIPYVGPILAPIAATVAFAAVSAFDSGIASASGGFDIPAGINPLTQLHQKEMVLPAEHADTIRGLGKGAGGPVEAHFHISTPDPGAFSSWLRNGAAEQITNALKKHNRLG